MVKKRTTNKLLLYISVITLIVIIIGVLLYIQRTKNPALSACIKEWEAKNLKPTEYSAGSVFVEFIPTLTEQEAGQLIQKNKLSILRSYFTEDNSYSAYIEVPAGSEIKWLCKFKINALVRTASVIYKST